MNPTRKQIKAALDWLADATEMLADPPPIPDRESDLPAFIADVTARYPVSEIYLFGSRSGKGREPKPKSDWDVLVCCECDTGPLVNDRTLQRHFGQFLDIFATSTGHGPWDFPDWTMAHDGGRGWFPESHPEIEGSLVRVYPEPGR